jgi:hypothetical protein
MGAKIATCERGKIAITREDLKTVVYLKTEHLVDGRSVNVIPLRDGENWRMWIDTGNGLVEGKMIDVVEGDYVGRSAAKPTDLSLSRRCAPSGVDPVLTEKPEVIHPDEKSPNSGERPIFLVVGKANVQSTKHDVL